MSQSYRFPGVSRELSQPDLQQQLRQAYERGVEEGKQQGLIQGRQQAEQQALEQAQQQLQQQQQQHLMQLKQQFSAQLQQLSQQLSTTQQVQQQHLTQQLSELIATLARSTLDAELTLCSSHLKRAIEHCLTLLQLEEQITAIHLAPADLALWQHLEIDLLGEVKLQADPQLQPGCAEFVGISQLHLLDFRQRLDAMLPQLEQLLLSNTDAAV